MVHGQAAVLASAPAAAPDCAKSSAAAPSGAKDSAARLQAMLWAMPTNLVDLLRAQGKSEAARGSR
eukprot:6468602-Alexandrium_andersonii.AAC.1